MGGRVSNRVKSLGPGVLITEHTDPELEITDYGVRSPKLEISEYGVLITERTDPELEITDYGVQSPKLEISEYGVLITEHTDPELEITDYGVQSTEHTIPTPAFCNPYSVLRPPLASP
jgi:hypothetical protein